MRREDDLNPNPNPGKVSDAEFDSHSRQQTKRPRQWLSLTLKKTIVSNSNSTKINGSEFNSYSRQLKL